MDLLLETAFNRLLPKYERTFGELPPFSSAPVEEVVSHMRRRLAEVPDADKAGISYASHPATFRGPNAEPLSASCPV